MRITVVTARHATPRALCQHLTWTLRDEDAKCIDCGRISPSTSR